MQDWKGMPIANVSRKLPSRIVNAIRDINRLQKKPIVTLGDFIDWVAMNSLSEWKNVGGLAIFEVRRFFRGLGVELPLCRKDAGAINGYFHHLAARLGSVEHDLRRWVFGASAFSEVELEIMFGVMAAKYQVLPNGDMRAILVIPGFHCERGIWMICSRLFGILHLEAAKEVLRLHGIPWS